MLKFRSFEVKDYEEINKFLDTHVPYGTAEQGGIMLHQGFVVIKYDDGRVDDQRDMVQLLRKRIDENKGKLLSTHVEIQLLNIQIDQIKPKGYNAKTPAADLKALFKAEGYNPSESNTMSDQLLNFRQAIFISSKEIERLQHTNAVMEGMVEQALKSIK